jgi:DegV family protein with EDD domain
VTVVPMWLTIGGKPVRDGELSLEEVVGRLGEGLSTSGPTPGEFAEAILTADQGDGVVVLTLAKEMSSTHDSARLATKLVEHGNVELVDTGTAAGAEGLVVLEAARAAAQGRRLEEVAAAARRAMASVRLVATLPTLDYLARSGRVPGAAAWAGRWLGVNPLFEFKEGKVHPLRPALGQQAARERMLSMWAHDRPPEGRLHLAAMHALDPTSAEELLSQVRERVEPASAFVGSFSPVMVVHTGPGLVGLAWWWDVEGT